MLDVPRSTPPDGATGHDDARDAGRPRSAGTARFAPIARMALAVATIATSAAASTASAPDGGDVIVLRGASDADVDPVRLLPPPPDGPRSTSLGGGWRHDFDLVLTTNDRDLIVYDARGLRRRFVALPPDHGAAPRRYVGHRTDDGDIVVRDGLHVWRRPDTTRVTFRGSQPIGLSSADGSVKTLRYDAARLIAVRGDDGRTTTFGHDGGRLSTVTLGDGTRFETTHTGDGRLAVHRVPGGECRPDARCDVADHPPGDAFAKAPGIPGAIRVDARPGSCRSYFVDLYGTDRGSAIERGLDGLPHYAGFVPTVANFPIADFVGHEIRVIRSRDLASPTYDAVPDGLYERLLRDGREIADDLLAPLARDGRLVATELGRTTTLLHRPDRPVVLELVVRHGLASSDQQEQIARAGAELLARHGIVLRVIEIP